MAIGTVHGNALGAFSRQDICQHTGGVWHPLNPRLNGALSKAVLRYSVLLGNAPKMMCTDLKFGFE